METDGKRALQFHQLCFCTSNAEMVSELIRRVREFLCVHPDVRIVGVVPEDGLGMCQCATCRAVDVDPDDAFASGRDYRDPANENRSISRRYAKLLNSVARAMRDEFPGVLVGGIAYVDLQWPPRDVALEDNSTMQVAIYWRDGARPLAAMETSTTNRFFFDLLQQWRSKLRSPLLLNEYYEGMQAQRSLPYPMVDVIAEDWENLAALPVEGATIQCTAGCQEAYALNMLAFSQCAWGEKVDSNRLLDEYVLNVFGNAGRALRPIFRSLLDAATVWRKGGNELLPEGTNIVFFWNHIGADRVAVAIELARTAATTNREERQVELFARYLQYCELAAQAMDVSLRIRQVENNDEIEARRLQEQLVHHELPAVIQYLEQTKVTGWILPRATTRWKSDLNATSRKLEVVLQAPTPI